MKVIAADVLEKEIRSIAAEVLELDEGRITPGAKFVEDLGMDSMMALEILAAAEKKFGIKIPEEYLTKVTSVGSMVEIAQKIMTGK
ncbi:MAG: phosphopantetheine-binding protein [Candidatus Omnitrophota bacterium]